MRRLDAHPVGVRGGVFAALSEFASQAVRPRSPLARAIVLVLWLKLVLVLALTIYLHADGPRPVTADDTLARLVGPTR